MNPDDLQRILFERYTPAEALEMGEKIVAAALAKLNEEQA